ncbi:MAG: 2-oxoacid:acceptor oxidoreductase family protein [Planctomycetota bacterium]
MLEKMIMAGFGGQGIMFLGKLLCYSYMHEDKNVTYIPSYGAEMRGGTANCAVQLSDNVIASPLVAQGTANVVMNQPSYEKFKGKVEGGGTLYVNKSLVELEEPPKDVKIREIPATDMANEMGDVRMANMIMLGAMIHDRGWLPIDTFRQRISEKFLFGRKAKFLEPNVKALETGLNYAKENWN